MIDVEHCNFTQYNNIIGHNNILFAIKDNVPDCHLLKLGTMGEYGTPNLDIPEGYFEIEYRGRKDKLPFPRQPGSWYHLTKVHDTWNLMFANKIWGIRATDVMQGVVHGLNTLQMVNDDLLTRFDCDEVFGTAINRFCAQAVIGHELTPYGKGGQTRGYLALRDSMQCFTIAIENPPKEGEYRVFNQFDELYSVNDLAEHVSKVAQEYDLEGKIWNIPNPRLEAEEHYYEPDMEHLPNLGFKPTFSLEKELNITIPKLMEYKDRIEVMRHTIDPKIKWTA
jgi:nucleoside-diphosphate-sugar epimerase